MPALRQEIQSLIRVQSPSADARRGAGLHVPVLPQDVQDACPIGGPQEQPHQTVPVHRVLATVRLFVRRACPHTDSQEGQQFKVQLLHLRRVVRQSVRAEGSLETARPGRAGPAGTRKGGGGPRGRRLFTRGGGGRGRRVSYPVAAAGRAVLRGRGHGMRLWKASQMFVTNCSLNIVQYTDENDDGHAPSFTFESYQAGFFSIHAFDYYEGL